MDIANTEHEYNLLIIPPYLFMVFGFYIFKWAMNDKTIPA